MSLLHVKYTHFKKYCRLRQRDSNLPNSRLLIDSLRQPPTAVWDLLRVAETLERNEIHLSKRSVERLLDRISWLETSSDSKDQLDGNGGSGVQMVLSSLLSDAPTQKTESLFCLLTCN